VNTPLRRLGIMARVLKGSHTCAGKIQKIPKMIFIRRGFQKSKH